MLRSAPGPHPCRRASPDAGALGAAIAADRRNRLRRNRVLMGAAAAAVLIVAVALAGTVGDDDPDRIIAGSDVETTLAPETIARSGPPGRHHDRAGRPDDDHRDHRAGDHDVDGRSDDHDHGGTAGARRRDARPQVR